jgi:hypothetical protein
MNNDQRQEAIFGAWDGVVSIVGFIFALLANHSPESAIAIGGFGGAIAAKRKKYNKRDKIIIITTK